MFSIWQLILVPPPDDVSGQNPLIVKWPYPGYTQMQPAFFNNEFPDPLPECNQGGPSGNPISVQFNPADTPPNITALAFTLQDSSSNTINTQMLDANNNAILTSRENGIEIASIDNSQTTYHDSGLLSSTTYTYTVKATDE